MPKTKISEFSATPANNTDIDSINIAEGCAPSGINDAIRELMAQLKDFQTGAVGDSFNGPVGSTTAGTGAFTTLSASSTTTLSGLTASTALALDASKNVVSVTNTGTGSNVLATSPTLVTPALGTPSSGVVTNLTGTASININGTVGATTASTGAFTTLAASGVSTFSAGTAALPALTTTGDTNTGIFFPAADTIAFAEGGVEAARFDSSGRLGIATTSPSELLTVGAGTTSVNSVFYLNGGSDSAKGAGIKLAKAGTAFGFIGAASWMEGATSNDLAFSADSAATIGMRLTSSGEVLVGGSAPIFSYKGLSIQGDTSNAALLALYRNDTSIVSTNDLGLIGFYGNDTTSNTPTQLAYIKGQASGTHAAGDNPTDLVFATTPSGSATVTERARITSAGNLGLGVTPSAWTGFTALQFGECGAVAANDFGTDNAQVILTNNTFYDGAYKYIATGDSATRYQQSAGSHFWATAPSGTAGNAVTFTTAMTLNASGLLQVGTTSPAGGSQITAYGASNGQIAVQNSTNWSRMLQNAGDLYIDNGVGGSAGNIIFRQGSSTTERARIDSSGNFLVTGAGGLGYGTGSGGAVTQATSRTTGVTLNKTNGAITLVSAAGLATFQSFTVTNSTVSATDVVSVVQKSGTDLYQIFVTAVAAGSFRITFATTGGITTEQPVFNFAVLKAVTA